MNTKTKERVNVAPSSTEGHYIVGSPVVNLDAINETFFVEKPSTLETKNHTTLVVKKPCLITCQTVFNPLSRVYEKSRD